MIRSSHMTTSWPAVAYMREMYDIYGSPGFLAAYNAGPARLDDYLANNRPLPDETRRYVAMIGPNLLGVYPHSRSPAEQYAMNALPINIPRATGMAGRCNWPAAPAAVAAFRCGRRWSMRSCRNRLVPPEVRPSSNSRCCCPPLPHRRHPLHAVFT